MFIHDKVLLDSEKFFFVQQKSVDLFLISPRKYIYESAQEKPTIRHVEPAKISLHILTV